jgi:hypothetical protein
MAPQTHHLVFRQGTTLLQVFQFRHVLMLAKKLSPSVSTPVDRLYIRAMTVDLPSGYELVFDRSDIEQVVLTTASITPAGSGFVHILPYTGSLSLPIGAATRTLPRDLTGQVWSGAIKSDYRQLSKLLVPTFTTDPLQGILTIEASDAATALMPANCRYDQLPAQNDWQRLTAYSSDVLKKGYYWDAEYRINGRTFAMLQGRCFVFSEATAC